ncbi:hypothetical protein D3C72_1897790 [compost metagenome]
MSPWSGASSTARSITFSSSRMLPGQACLCTSSAALSVRPRSFLPYSALYFSTKRATSAGMSAVRSRSGGIWIGKVLSR